MTKKKGGGETLGGSKNHEQLSLTLAAKKRAEPVPAETRPQARWERKIGAVGSLFPRSAQALKSCSTGFEKEIGRRGHNLKGDMAAQPADDSQGDETG